METSAPGITTYVSVSVERGQVKTSCSVHLTTGTEGDNDAHRAVLADKMANAVAVAALATQSVQGAIAGVTPAQIDGFLRRVQAAAHEAVEGR